MKRLQTDPLVEETIAYLWSRYDKDRTNTEIRNRLVEHYTPMAQEIARRYIRRFGLCEAEAAIGDALLLLVTRLVPKYDGKRSFPRWAMLCIRHRLSERRKLEALHRKHYHANLSAPGNEDEWLEIVARDVRPDEPGSDVRFADLASALSARLRDALAAVLSPPHAPPDRLRLPHARKSRRQADTGRDRRAAEGGGVEALSTEY